MEWMRASNVTEPGLYVRCMPGSVESYTIEIVKRPGGNMHAIDDGKVDREPLFQNWDSYMFFGPLPDCTKPRDPYPGGGRD